MENWEQIRKHELYIKDYDDEFDNTYAYIEFKVPDKYKETAKHMFKGEPISFEDKFNKELEDMNKPGTEAYERAEIIANKIVNAIDSGNNTIIGLQESKMGKSKTKIDVLPIPETCRYCGNPVVYTSNSEIYGKEYGNGKCYLCRNCKAFVRGTYWNENTFRNIS